MKKENGVLTRVTKEDIKLLETNPQEFWKGVTSIGNYAFSFCKSLESIHIPDSVTSIGNDAFSFCDSLQSINIPDSVTCIKAFAFSDCYSLRSINIPDSVTSIGDRAFSGCESLQSINIPDSVTCIGDRAFSGCENLNIKYKGKVFNYKEYKDRKIPIYVLLTGNTLDLVQDLKPYSKIVSKFVTEQVNEMQLRDLFVLGVNLGLFSKDKMEIRGANGKVTTDKISSQAFNIAQKLLSKIPVEDMHMHF